MADVRAGRGKDYDVIIIGAGPAGLSAALVLGRCRRRVLVIDDGRPRNARADAVHGFLTRDGTSPSTLLEIATAQLQPYSVTLEKAVITRAARHGEGFEIHDAAASRWTGRKLLLATGVGDRWMDIPGITDFAGAGVYQCPYCHGWEVRDRRLGMCAFSSDAVDAAVALKTWSSSVTLFTGGVRALDPAERQQLARHEIAFHESRPTRLLGGPGNLEGVQLESGATVPLEALFMHAGQEPNNSLATQLGCSVDQNGTISGGAEQQTSVPGLFVAGDLAATIQSVAVAVAEGYKAGVAINKQLRQADHG